MELGKIIAFNLKELRTERNLTLGQLSKISGISKAMLSDIEKGNSNPTINTIWKIANGLNVPYTKLMDGIEKEATVIRKTDSVMQTGETEHYRVYCYFTNTPVRNFELFYVELDAQSSNASIGHSEKSQEYIYIIQGELVLHTEAGDYTLNVGDSLVFDSSIGHTYINKQDTLLIFMVINYYPS
ncbi:helix-turn-helix transcriptional regulator [Sedimentibacter hydroxybenzoicus DSM 7310]|uniref:Helix-turn-helix transcriptional regulator n=1 Tax=Sedimentibacter hydroxybenzoicus DSM 7310 TaxID=1123245 RepID=A0A974GWX5_SEDHY|nr:XRE family transcriptional regulator [Sedimentibacter hydroxybenzoicus]NYB74962.1 helix-turn-helix transcriptional regulator [Sedimentibacter hydroxybenzoicus DSM 7310]